MDYTHLVMYEGGGYSGCFWEWNAFLCRIEKNRITAFKSVFHSGYAGIDNIETANQHFTGLEKESNRWDLVKLSSKKDVTHWQNEYNAGLVAQITEKVNKVTGLDTLFLLCDDCGTKVFEDGQTEGYEGCGGLAVQATKKYCYDCYINHRCGYCGEFFSDTSKAEFSHDDDRDRCCYCRE